MDGGLDGNWGGEGSDGRALFRRICEEKGTWAQVLEDIRPTFLRPFRD